MTLEELKPGTSGRIVNISGDSRSRRRIVDMGVTPGTLVEVERVAPLGDPIEVRVRGYRLLVRKSEASHITVELG
jgi:Fe2+ transport system protein FeoA